MRRPAPTLCSDCRRRYSLNPVCPYCVEVAHWRAANRTPWRVWLAVAAVGLVYAGLIWALVWRLM